MEDSLTFADSYSGNKSQIWNIKLYNSLHHQRKAFELLKIFNHKKVKFDFIAVLLKKGIINQFIISTDTTYACEGWQRIL